MIRIAPALGLLTIGVAGVTGSVWAGSFLVGVDLARRATRPVEDSPAGWNRVVIAQARVGLDIAFASGGAR
jgi:hypothetical protein